MTQPLTLVHGKTTTVIAACRAAKFTIPQTAYALASANHETNGLMKPVVEAYWLSEDWRKRNLRYYPWYGRGFIQLTWERNYRKMAKRLARPEIAANPDVLLTDARLSARVLAIGMQEGIFTGKRLDRYINANTKDYKGARRVVNGQDKADKVARLARAYETLLRARENARTPRGVKPAPEKTPNWFVALLRRIFGLA